jgi:hypothetical protein
LINQIQSDPAEITGILTGTHWPQTGLFSAAVATLISVSIQDLRQNLQDTSNFYLANTYQAAINPNTPNISSTLPASPPPFSPPKYVVWVNALWFLSLVISLTCALLATFLQQWARRYLKVTHSRYSPHKRARIRAFFAKGVEKCLLPWVVETLPTLLHISLFLFFAGLVVFLSNVNLTVFKLVMSWVAICTALYGCITLMPIICHDSPYYTSLFSLVWRSVIGVACLVSAVSGLLLYCTVFYRRGSQWLFDFTDRCYNLLLQGMQKTAEETALKSPSEIDNHAFMWTFYSLDEDHELERFFAGFPALRSSKVVADPLPGLTKVEQRALSRSLRGLMNCSFSSDLLPAPFKDGRAMICAKAIDPAYFPHAYTILDLVLSNYQYSGPLATAVVQTARSWKNNADEDGILRMRATISMIVARVQPRDDSWFILASDALGIQETVLRDYAAHGDSLSLAILIHVVRRQFSHIWKEPWPTSEFSFVLSAASKFNAEHTPSALQHEFCTLWNQIVRKAQHDSDQLMVFAILKRIRNVYVALHQNIDSSPTQFFASTDSEEDALWLPLSYPLCDIPTHHPDSIPHIHDNDSSTAFARTVQHGNGNTALVTSSLTGPDPSSAPSHPSLRVNETLTAALPLDNTNSLPVQRSPEYNPIPAILPTPVTAHTIYGSLDTSPSVTSLSTSEPLASLPPTKSKPSTSPQDVVSVEHLTFSHVASNGPNVPFSASPGPFCDVMLPTGLLLPSDSAVTGSDHLTIRCFSRISSVNGPSKE